MSPPRPKRTEVVDGVTIKYHANGETVWSRGRIEDGRPEGYWEWYRIDGTLKRSGTFKAGEPIGTWTTYNAQGDPHKTTER